MKNIYLVYPICVLALDIYVKIFIRLLKIVLKLSLQFNLIRKVFIWSSIRREVLNDGFRNGYAGIGITW